LGFQSTGYLEFVEYSMDYIAWRFPIIWALTGSAFYPHGGFRLAADGLSGLWNQGKGYYANLLIVQGQWPAQSAPPI
jgi:hypothetical protein